MRWNGLVRDPTELFNQLPSEGVHLRTVFFYFSRIVVADLIAQRDDTAVLQEISSKLIDAPIRPNWVGRILKFIVML